VTKVFRILVRGPYALRMTTRVRASIVVIGDEILDGHTRDTNSGWLARRLSELGIPLDRIVTVPDDPAAIGEALRTELGRAGVRLVVSSGGIGSTPDDLTMEAVADFLGVGVTSHPRLDKEISRWVEQARDEGVTIPDAQETAMRRMARVPEGSYLLPGTEGMLPGVAIDRDGGVAGGGATIVILPGVPSEFQRLVDLGVRDLLDGLGEPQHVAEVRHPYPESALTPLLDRLVVDFPDVHVGSYPGRECMVRLKGPERQVTEAMARVRAAVEALEDTRGSGRMRERWQGQFE
jgi:nicotinamide-nucleotide amidase